MAGITDSAVGESISTGAGTTDGQPARPSLTGGFRPIGDRVLIKPLANPTMTASGLLHVVEHHKPEMQGTVVAVGPCEHPLKTETEEYATLLDQFASYDHLNDPDAEIVRDCAAIMRELVQREPLVKVGDNVVFSWAGGQEIFLEDGDAEQRFLIMRESDILAVVEE